MARESVIEKVTRSFRDKSVVLNENEIKIKERLFAILEIKMEDPFATDYDIYLDINDRFEVSYTQVIREVTFAERVVAANHNPDMDPRKAWTRYFINEMGKRVLKMAEKKGDLKTMARTLDIIGKHQLTDKEDIDRPPYDKIVPFNPIPTFDPTVLGIKPLENLEEIREKYIKKFGIAKDRYILERTIKIDEKDVEDVEVIKDGKG